MTKPTSQTYGGYLAYLPDERARQYIKSERARRKSVSVLPDVVRICRGNAYDALVLSQILYWHGTDENDQPRLRYEQDGHLWLVKQYSDFEAETGVNERTVRVAIARLEKLGLIHRHVGISTYHSGSMPRASFIRMNWVAFFDALDSIETAGNVTSKDAKNSTQEGVETTQHVTPKRHDMSLPKRHDMSFVYTDSTTESTKAEKPFSPEGEKLSADAHTQASDKPPSLLATDDASTTPQDEPLPANDALTQEAMQTQPDETTKPTTQGVPSVFLNIAPIPRRKTWAEMNGWERTDFPHYSTLESIVSRWGRDTRESYTANHKRIQVAVAFMFDIAAGAYAGKRAQQLLGLGTGKYKDFNITPAMTPTEIVAFKLWYKKTYPEQRMVEQAEQVQDYVLRFRDHLLQLSQQNKPQINNVWQRAESKLASLLGEQDPHELIDDIPNATESEN
jgi:hypothetical protein